MALDISTAVEWFESFEDSTTDSRRLAERDIDYYDGKQLTTEELKTLAKRKQPPVINNKIKPKIDYLLGLERQNRTDPKALPRTPKHEDEAGAATDALRYVADVNKFPQIRSECFEDGLKPGAYGAQVIAKPKKNGEFDITIKRISWDRLFYDPHSMARNFSDAKYKGIVIWMDRTDAIAMFPDKESVINTADTDSPSKTETFDDKPTNRWVDTKRNRVRIVQMEYKESGVWHYAFFTKSDFLDGPKVSPYVDDNGDPCDSIELQSAYIDRDGNRYGEVRQFIDMQDEINKRRSKGLHLLNTRQVTAEKGAVDNVRLARQELAKPDGYIEVNPGLQFNVLPTNDLAAGNFQMLQEAKQEIDKQGANVSSADTNSLSGRSRQILRQENNMEIGALLDGLRDWENRIYRHVWNRIRQYWTDEKWIRVTDDENGLKYVALNKRTTAGEKLLEELRGQGQEVTQEDMMALAMDPRAAQEVIENNVAELDVDIILDDVPDTVTVQQEQFETIAQLYPSVPPQMQGMAFKFLVEASSLRNKKKFLEEMQGGGEDPHAAMARQQEEADMKMLERASAEAKINKDNASATKSMADAHATINPPPDTAGEMMIEQQDQSMMMQPSMMQEEMY